MALLAKIANLAKIVKTCQWFGDTLKYHVRRAVETRREIGNGRVNNIRQKKGERRMRTKEGKT